MTSHNDDPYDCSHVHRQWERLKQQRQHEREQNLDKSTYTLEQIAKDDKDPIVRIAAINKLQPQSSKYTLEQIAKNDKDPSVRAAATSRLLG